MFITDLSLSKFDEVTHFLMCPGEIEQFNNIDHKVLDIMHNMHPKV